VDFSVLKPDVQKFIVENTGVDIAKLAFSRNPFTELNWQDVLGQIAARSKAEDKLPTWFNTQDIVYPPKISIEQTSSEKTAEYKARIVSGKKLIDITGGFGVDDYYFAKRIDSIIHCEINPELSEIASHNFKQLGVVNIRCFSGDGLKTLKSFTEKFDWIYIDPSRRHDAKGKVFMLADCLPNVTELLDTYFAFADNILIKTAPILDITAGLSELDYVKVIHIVASENEVKELLWILSKDYSGPFSIKTVNLLKEYSQEFDIGAGPKPAAKLADTLLQYLYEPNAAIMKSGAFDEVGNRFNIKKLHQHSHLYTSDKIHADFPGRIFEIAQQVEYNKKLMKQFLENRQANITIRNFSETVADIRKKWKIKDGGSSYVFFTTRSDERKIALICTKIK
jgi:hypothetical protein